MQIACIYISYVLYLPDQQLPQIRPTFPPIFLAITRCAAIERTSFPAVNLNSGAIDVHVPVMGTDRVRANDPCPSTMSCFVDPENKSRVNIRDRKGDRSNASTQTV